MSTSRDQDSRTTSEGGSRPDPLERVPPHIKVVVDASIDPTAILDVDLNLIYYNQCFLRLSGLEVRQIRKQRWSGMCHHLFRLESCERSGCIARQAAALKRPLSMHEVESRRDGRKFIITAIPLIRRVAGGHVHPRELSRCDR